MVTFVQYLHLERWTELHRHQLGSWVRVGQMDRVHLRMSQSWTPMDPAMMLPSGKPTKNYGQSPCWMGQFTINKWWFSSSQTVNVYQKVDPFFLGKTKRYFFWRYILWRNQFECGQVTRCHSSPGYFWWLPSGKRLNNCGKIHYFSWVNPLFQWYPLLNLKRTMDNHYF